MILKVLAKEDSVVELAHQYGVSRKTIYKWLSRYDSKGLSGLVDESRRPKRSPMKTSAELALEIVSLRTIAWFGRGFRPPLRDFLLADDEVGPTHFGRAYGFERSADMIGAVVGPLIAAALVWRGMPFDEVILWSIIPSALSGGAIGGLTRDRRGRDTTAAPSPITRAPAACLLVVRWRRAAVRPR